MYRPLDEKKLMTELWDPQLADNLEAFVMFVFPWGKDNTPLARFEGPRTWQRDELQAITEHLKTQNERALIGLTPTMYQSATVSGRGIGKSSLVSWLNLWMMTTRLGSTSITSANTEDQLKSKTWAELGKWHTLAINAHWFERNTLALKPAQWFEKELKRQLKIDTGYYYAQAQLWSEEKPDSFAGAHNHNGELVVFDEASGIPEPIWTVTEGFFTEPIVNRFWLCFSNGRRNTGSFFECFHKHRNYWRRRHIDSRTVEGTDVAKLEQILTKYGEDSDEARIEVKGQFPRQGDRQFISREAVENATLRPVQIDAHAPLIMGVDVARFGDDKSVIRFRKGRDGRSIPALKFKGLDNMELANECAHWITKLNPDAVCIDAGNGTGVIDRLREMGYKVHEVWFGSKSPDDEYSNLRTAIWARVREWLGGGSIDDDSDLIDDLAGPQYKFAGASDKIMLESKEEMKKRGLASPDDGDALACTFAIKVAHRDLRTARRSGQNRARVARDVDYRIFGG
jgi:hypothetical protein